MATEWVRVKDTTTKHEYTTAKEAVRDGESIIKKEAVDSQGVPLPGKPHLARGQRTAESPKENA